MSEILSYFFILIAIFSLTAAGGILSERSGIVNLSLEGYLMLGALGSLISHALLGYGNNGQSIMGVFWVDAVSILMGVLFSMVGSILFSLGTINFRGNHAVVGVSINILFAALIYVFMVFDSNGSQILVDQLDNGARAGVYRQANDEIINFYNLIYAFASILVIAILWWMIRYTKFGLRLWASGENPNALAASGVNVYAIRWGTQFLVAALVGVAGSFFIVYNDGKFLNSVEGMGYIALAFVVISQWRIHYLVPSLLVICFLMAWIKFYTTDVLNENKDLAVLTKTIPFVLPLIILPIFKNTSNAPKNSGVVYDPSKR